MATPKKQKEAAKKGGIPAEARKFAHVITRLRITEKAATGSEGNVYTFDVASGANKISVKNAIKELYGVSPIRVNILTMPRKNVVVRGKRGVRGGGRKAYVYLKKGEQIEFV